MLQEDLLQVDSSECQCLHDKLTEFDRCPFCDSVLATIDKPKSNQSPYQCCLDPNIRDFERQLTCAACGQVVGDDLKTEYIDYRENIFKIYKKSIYNRKCHLKNTSDKLITQHGVNLQVHDIFKIHKIFVEINRILPKVNKKRKWIISLKYLLFQIFILMKWDYKNIELAKFVKTMDSYKLYRKQIMALCGDKIRDIIRK